MMPRPASPACHRARRRGATLFELVIVAAVMALLVGTLLNRIAWYQQQAELAGAQQVVLALRGALRLQASALLARDGGERALRALAEQNPMGWLVQAPANYAGEYYAPVISELPDGAWCYDKSNKILIYLLTRGKNVYGSEGSVMKFKVKLLKEISEPGTSRAPNRIILEQIPG